MSTIAIPAASLSDLIAELRAVKDRKDEINARLKEASAAEDGLEVRLLAAMEAAGFTKSGDKVSSADGTATRQLKTRAKYDPEMWPEIVKWAVEHDRTDIVQRRLTDVKIIELIDSGMNIPGVDLDSFTQLSFRRS